MPMPWPDNPILNPTILEILKTYPTDGTHDYFWEPGFDGVTSDLYYAGERIARAEEKRRTYCSGLTFEVYFSACELYLRRRGVDKLKIDGLNPWGLRKMKSDWYVAGEGQRRGPVDALVKRGLGIQIEALHDAIPGDFLQLWRENESGHSVILLGFDADSIRYWSTQTRTVGIGENTEYFFGKNSIKFDELYIARAFVPSFA